MSDFPPAEERFPVITNRHGLRVFVKLLTVPGARGNAYLVHGFSDVHDTAHMRAMTAACIDSGYNVIVWDATHSWGRSAGNLKEASFYFHYEDLEDVLEWSMSQSWYRPRFVLVGHSLGAIAAGTYAASHAGMVERLVLVSPVVSGKAVRRRIPLPVRAWWRLRGTLSSRGRGKERVGWELMRSGWAYNLLANAHRLTMPMLIVTAGRDWLTPKRLSRKLWRSLPAADRKLVVVPRARHSFDSDQEASKLREVVTSWLTDDER